MVIEAENTCMTMRGRKKPGSRTLTCCALGAFESDAELRREAREMMER